MTPITHLLMTRAEAERLLQNQIRRGKDISVGDMSEESLNKAVEKVDKWEQETTEILSNMFDTSELADKFLEAAEIYKKGESFQQKLYYTCDRIIYKNHCLDEINERLSFYEEQVVKESELDFWSLIHPSISGLCKSRFDDGHFADSIETAFKFINQTVKSKVKRKTGNEFDGASLMNKAFSINSPIISLDDLSTENGKNIQLGYMQIFAGSMIGIRNPKAHSVISIDRENGIHLLFLASLLMYKLDEAM
jgi:uncharacterized protein (TIGR02391 family)